MYERERSTAAGRYSAEGYFDHADPARSGLHSKSTKNTSFCAMRIHGVLGAIMKGQLPQCGHDTALTRDRSRIRPVSTGDGMATNPTSIKEIEHILLFEIVRSGSARRPGVAKFEELTGCGWHPLEIIPPLSVCKLSEFRYTSRRPCMYLHCRTLGVRLQGGG